MVTEHEVRRAILWAERYINHLWKEIPPNYGAIAEYPAIPLSTHVHETEKSVQAGFGHVTSYEECVITPVWTPYCKLETISDNGEEWYGKYKFEDDLDPYSLVNDWNEPVLEVKYYPNGDGYMFAEIKVLEHDGMYNVDLYGRSYTREWLLWRLGGGRAIPTETKTLVTPRFQAFPSHRYTVRHGCQMGFLHYWFDSAHRFWRSRAFKIIDLLDHYGFTYDWYHPLWRYSDDYPDDYFGKRQSLHDADVWGDLPRGLFYYPYFSKVLACPALILELTYPNTTNPALMSLRAMHAMNKYNSATADDLSGNTAKEYLLDGWYIGIDWQNPVKHWFVENEGVWFNIDDVYTTYILSCVLAAMAELGYGFGYEEAKIYADKAAEILVKCQWGYPFDTGHVGEGEHEDFGVVNRPDHTGGFFTCYMVGVDKPFRATTRKPWWEELADYWAMPLEFGGMTPTNQESTILSMRALRIYYTYKYEGATGLFPRSIVMLEGDITGPDGVPDGKVDIKDLAVAAKAYGSYPGASNWNPDADITGPIPCQPDNKVDIRDISTMASQYGVNLRSDTLPPRS